MKAFIKSLIPIQVLDIILAPFVYPSAVLLKRVRQIGVHRLPLCKSILFKLGVFPIRNHYYEPQFDNRGIRDILSLDRTLPGINWNVSAQLALLKQFTYADELKGITRKKKSELEFYFGNDSFESGDAEYLYQIIRALKPRHIFEIGSGNSTLIARRGINRNKADDANYECKHVCIEPYEVAWLERTGAHIVRKKVEDLGTAYFKELQRGDILFIDSSHIIRPHGDVLFEYLELLPSLNPGVIVHVHDIFSPKNYLKQWLDDQVLFWNEQYLLEAFLSHNEKWEVLGALNYLHHHHYEELRAVAPYLTPDREPGSFYLRSR